MLSLIDKAMSAPSVPRWILFSATSGLAFVVLIILPSVYQYARPYVIEAFKDAPGKTKTKETTKAVNQTTIKAGDHSQNTPIAITNTTEPKVITAAAGSQNTISAGPTNITQTHGGSPTTIHGDSIINITVINNNGSYKSNIGTVQKRKIRASTATGGFADIEVHLLYNSASWALASSSRFANKRGGLDFNEFLDDKKFATDASTYDAIVCLGLDSGYWNRSGVRTSELSDKRAVHLCDMLSKKEYIRREKTAIFGLPLGFNLDKNVILRSDKELNQRSVVIIGVKLASGDLQSEVQQQRIISKILHDNEAEGFVSTDYSEVASKSPLRYIRVERGTYTPY